MIFRRIDDFLIDKVFQRAADMMARWTTPRVLAQNALMLASLLEIWVIWLCSQAGKLTLMTVIFGPLLVIFLLYLAFSAGKSTKEGFIPTERMKYFFLRSLVFGAFIFYVVLTAAVINYVPADIIDFAVIARDATELSGLYWMACRTNPPTRQRQEFGKMAPNKI